MADASAAATTEEEGIVAKLRAQHSFLGHPKAIGTLSFMQLCNSFSNYGMQAILVYYLYTSVAEGGLGLAKADAAQLMSLYSAVLLLCGLVGSVMADRVLGPRRALRLARLSQTIGYALLALPFLGIVGYAACMGFLLFSTMLCGRSVEALINKMYTAADERRDGAFSIAYVISNVGALSTFVTGSMALVTGYSLAFALCAVLAFLGFAAYVVTEKKFFGPVGVEPDDPMEPAKRRRFLTILGVCIVAVVVVLSVLFSTGALAVSTFANSVSTVALVVPIAYFAYVVKSKKTKPEEAKHLMGLVPLFLCNCLAMCVYTQSVSILAIYAETTVDRMLFGFEITPAAFQTLSAIFAIAFGSIATALWTKIGDKQPSTPAKTAIGTVLYAASVLLMVLPFLLYPAGVKVSPLWLVGYYAIMTAGEVLISPSGYSASAAVAPAAFSTQMITVWSLNWSVGAGLSTLAVNFYHEGGEAQYFFVMGAITLVVGVVVWVFSKRLNHSMGLDAVK